MRDSRTLTPQIPLKPKQTGWLPQTHGQPRRASRGQRRPPSSQSVSLYDFVFLSVALLYLIIFAN